VIFPNLIEFLQRQIWTLIFRSGKEEAYNMNIVINQEKISYG